MRIHRFHQVYKARLAQSTKPFRARGANVDRCQYCQIEKPFCLCSYQPDINVDVAFLLLLSDSEIFKPSNTGKLIADTIKDTDVFIWSRHRPDERIKQKLSDPRYAPVVVFPQQYVEDKTRVMSAEGLMDNNSKIPLFILLDGSWREARKMFRKSPYLDKYPVISIHPDKLSQYLMRKSQNEEHLSTAEVSALILKQTGHQKAGQTLQYWFEAFRESYLISKTRGKIDQQRPSLTNYIAYCQQND